MMVGNERTGCMLYIWDVGLLLHLHQACICIGGVALRFGHTHDHMNAIQIEHTAVALRIGRWCYPWMPMHPRPYKTLTGESYNNSTYAIASSCSPLATTLHSLAIPTTHLQLRLPRLTNLNR